MIAPPRGLERGARRRGARARIALALLLALASCSGTGGAPRGAPAPPQRAAEAPAARADLLRRHVDALAAPELEGRLTGTPGEALAADYLAREFSALGLEPAGDAGGFLQTFEFTAGVALGPANALEFRGGAGLPRRLDSDWRPLGFSRVGDAPPAPLAFAGYGIVAPAESGQPGYDSYSGLDVRGCWVLVLRFQPEEVTAERRQQLNPYASLRHKAMLARDRGAIGLLVASGPIAHAQDPLVTLAHDPVAGASSLFALSLGDSLAERLLARAGRSLAELQRALDSGAPVPGFALPGLSLAARVDLVQERREGHNVVGRLRGDPEGAAAARAPLLLGAHFDHLGRGGSGSLAKPEERGQIHPGADDNASGVAALLELAAHFAERRRAAPASLRRDLIFAAWSGEELGLLGSQAWAERLPDPHAGLRADADPHALPAAAEPAGPAAPAPRALAAYLNFDMVGRLRGPLVVHGVGSSPAWPALLERAAREQALAISPQAESTLPTDATSFYLRGIPVLSFFTGVHDAYHSPRDLPDTLDYAGLARIVDLASRIAAELADADAEPGFQRAAIPRERAPRGGLRASLGTIPDYAAAPGPGAPLAGVGPDGPAERAGLQAGDRVVRLAGREIENLYDYTYAIQALRIDQPVPIEVLRGGRRLEFQITPVSRE